VPHLLRLDREAANLMQEIMTIKRGGGSDAASAEDAVTCGYTASLLVSGIGQSI
jgi:hypothetical protein